MRSIHPIRTSFAFVVAVASCSIVNAAGAVPDASAQTMREEILQADHAVFAAVFDTCDADALAPLIAQDFEFYHDKNGVMARTGQQFIASIRDNCAHRGEWRSRRELVPGSAEVYPIKDYGAMEIGVHRFYERKQGEPEHLAGTAKFSHVWKNENGRWTLSRVLSYGHEAVK